MQEFQKNQAVKCLN